MKSLRHVTVIYEDRRSQVPEYGPHKFLMACVRDRSIQEHPDLVLGDRVRARVAKGNSKLLKYLMDLNTDEPDGRQVVAIFDDDKIRDLAGLPGDACKAETIKTLRSKMDAPARVTLVLLARNIESVLEAIQRCAPDLVAPEVFQRALNKKPNERDLVFLKASERERSALRAAILRSRAGCSPASCPKGAGR